MENPSQFLGIDPDHDTDSNGRGAGSAEFVRSGQALLTEEVSRGEQRNRCFFPGVGNNGELGPAQPNIKQTVGTVSLRRKDLFRVDANDGSSGPRGREVCIRIEGPRAPFVHTQASHGKGPTICAV